MVDAVQTVTHQLASMALDAYSQRHRVLANNIANIHSDGFQPQRLNFEDQLSALRTAVLSGKSDSEISNLVDQIKPFVDLDSIEADKTTDPSVRLDDQIALVVQNTVQYQALVTALGKTNALMGLAISGA